MPLAGALKATIFLFAFFNLIKREIKSSLFLVTLFLKSRRISLEFNLALIFLLLILVIIAYVDMPFANTLIIR